MYNMFTIAACLDWEYPDNNDLQSDWYKLYIQETSKSEKTITLKIAYSSCYENPNLTIPYMLYAAIVFSKDKIICLILLLID